MKASVVVAIALTARLADAAPPPPSGAHPRLIIDADLKAAWQAQAKLPHGPVIGAMALCDDAINTKEHDRALYQGQEWAKIEAACLIAWQATGEDKYQKTAIKFWLALIDDLDDLGDGKGGDKAAWRDSGYAIRNLGPYTALGYDWLYDKLTDDQKARARQRWKSWLDWYESKGYRAHAPGSNYHAGYLISATMIAIAEGGEAGGDGDALWNRVADQMWSVEMARALVRDGVLEGGDWLEGWQYGPLSVAEYALGARLMKKYGGGEVPGIKQWLSSILRRHVYALTPAEEGTFAAGDTEHEEPNIPVRVPTLAAVALGDASADDKRLARGELARMKLTDKEYPLYAALAGVGERPVLVPRESWPTWYVADGANNLYARTRWDDKAVWFVAECSHSYDMDHRHPDAGNFVITRGKDNAIVDPSPYGSLSTLTSNAPTVDSSLPSEEFTPSQAEWGDATFEWTTQTASGVLAARCDYAKTFQYKEKKSQVPDATRDFVLLPNKDGTAAALVIVDAADTGKDSRNMFLRFYSTQKWDIRGESASAVVGGTTVSIDTVMKSGGGAPQAGHPTMKDCFGEGVKRGGCEAARFPANSYKLEIPGDKPRAVNIIGVTGGDKVTGKKLEGDGWAGVQVGGVRDAVVVWPLEKGKGFTYTGPRGATHVVLAAGGEVKASKGGDGCKVEVAGGDAKPVIVQLDGECQVSVDKEAPSAAGVETHLPSIPGVNNNRKPPRGGCCRGQTTPDTSSTMSFVVVGAIIVRRRRRKV